MKLSVHNIGKVIQAEVEINGITVIAGENNTGKSTIGKVLWSIFAGFCDVDDRIQEEKYNFVRRTLRKNRAIAARITSATIRNFLDDLENYSYSEVEKRDKIVEFLTYSGDGVLPDERDIGLLYSMINIPKEESVKNIVKNTISTEFNGKIANVFSDLQMGEVSLSIKGKTFNFTFNDAGEAQGDFQEFCSLTRPVYIDDPFVLDELEKRYGFALPVNVYGDHREMLKDMLTSRKVIDSVQDILNVTALNEVMNKISLVCSGRLQNSLRGYEYKLPGSEKYLSLRSLSTGMKAFVIMKQLIENGTIEYNGIIILDEPEIHLHPEWQLILAELIVLLQKEFNLHILLNTHSPYFLQAIEVYSKVHKAENICKYYMAVGVDEHHSLIKDVTEDREPIYQKLAAPLNYLSDLEYEQN